MLSLTRKTDYALIALSHMAHDPEGCCSAREIATRYRVPLPLLMNILKLLTRRGFAKSARGPHGGYRLVKRVISGGGWLPPTTPRAICSCASSEAVAMPCTFSLNSSTFVAQRSASS